MSESETNAATPLPPSPTGLIKPPQIPDHELLRRIGRGSYGEVWLARGVTGAYRAVKIVHRQSFDHVRPFEREFNGILKFEPISRNHDSQVDILHVGRAEDCFYYVMELADDQATGQQINPDSYAPKTLKSEIFQRGKLPFEECVQISLALTTALEHLHANGLVHRDVKPSNIIFVNGVPKLADIGLVTSVDASRSYVGTEGFAPPEGPGTPQADIYSLGKVLYELCTGKDRQDFPELPTNLDALTDREALLELNAVIAKACREDPRARYASAKAMHDELVLLQSGKSLARLHTLQRTTAKLRRASLAIAVVTVLATAAWIYQSRQTRQMRRLASENLALAQQAQGHVVELSRNELIARENLYAADISQAQQALAADNMRQAIDLLRKQIPKPGEPDLRGFEWRYLWHQCQSGELFTWRGHEDHAVCVAFSPDGRTLASGSWDKTLRTWDLASRRPLSILTEHTNSVYSVEFSPRGDLLAAVSKASLCLWDRESLQLLRWLPDAAFKARFSPDGRYLVTGSAKGLILWDAHTWSVRETVEIAGLWRGAFADVDGVGFGLGFSPDGTRIAVVSNDGVKLLSVPDFQTMALLTDRMPRLRFVAFSPDGHTLASCAAADKTVKLWDVDRQLVMKVCAGHSDSIYAAVFAPDGRTLATCSADQTVKLWDVAKGNLVRTFRGHMEEVWDVTFSPDGNLLVSVSKDGTIKLWDASAIVKQDAVLNSVSPMGFSLDGSLLALATNDTLIAFDPETLQWETNGEFCGRGGETNRWFGKLLTDGHTLTVLTGKSRESELRLELWDLNRHQLLASVDAINPFSVYARTRRLLASATSNHTVTLWQLPQGLRKFVLPNECDWRVAFSADEALLAATVLEEKRRGVKLWEVRENELHELAMFGTGERGSDGLAFSPDGQMLGRGDWDGSISLWGIPSGARIGTLTGHKRSSSVLSFTPDGRTLASTADDGTVRFWHVATQRELMRFEMPTSDPMSAALEFSSDGRTLFVSRLDANGRLTQVWYAPSFGEIAVAEGRQYRSAMPQDAASWHATGKALEKRNRLEEAVQAYTEAIQRCADQPDFVSLRNTALRHRAKLLIKLGCFAEAGVDNCAALNVPPRDSRTRAVCIDLSPYFNGSLDSEPLVRSIPARPFFDNLPRGLQILPGSSGIPFDLRGVIQLNHADESPGVRHSIEGIQLRQKCRRLHFLHSTGRKETEGTTIGAYVLHYADGGQVEIPLLYGQNLREWLVNSDSADLRGAKVAWTGTNSDRGDIRLFELTWENPHPEIELQTLDFVSKMTKCAPFLVAITAE